MNKLTQAANAAKKHLLLVTLELNNWNLHRTGVELGIGSTSNTRSQLLRLAPKEYRQAQKDGRITKAWKGR